MRQPQGSISIHKILTALQIDNFIYIQQYKMSQYFRKLLKKQQFPIPPSQIKFKTFFTNCIAETFREHQYTQTQADDWNIYWCEKQFIPETLDKMRVQPNKRVNHFRNFYQICRKDLLSKNVKKYKRMLDKEGKPEESIYYSFMPLTYNLPSEYSIFLDQYRKSMKDNRDKTIWIMKPIGRSQGKGIFLFNKINEISEWSETTNQPEPYIVQRYIHNPLLIGQKKFDLRIYVLVTSHNPLNIYLYRSGFARFTHCRYQSNQIGSLESHITNVGFQKNLQAYDQEKGGKYQLDKLRLYLLSKFGNQKVDYCFGLIQQLVIRTLTATSKIMQNDKRCFELYGFDVMIDSEFKPWLIQVNGSPSMTPSTKPDYTLKMGVLDDTLTILNLENLPGISQALQIGGFDCIFQNGARVSFEKISESSNPNPNIIIRKSFLGCHNNREQHLRKLAKKTAIQIAQQSRQPQRSNNTQNRINNRNNQAINRQRVGNQGVRQANGNSLQQTISSNNNSNRNIGNRRHNNSSNQYRITNLRDSARNGGRRVAV